MKAAKTRGSLQLADLGVPPPAAAPQEETLATGLPTDAEAESDALAKLEVELGRGASPMF